MQDREAVGETFWLRSAQPVVETKQTDAQTQTNYQAFCYSSPKRLFNIIQKCNKALHRSIGKQWHNQLSKLTKSNLYHCFSSATILKQMQSRTHLLSIWIKLKKIGPCGQSYD